MGEIFSTFIRRESSFSHTWTALELLLVALTCTLLTWYLQFLWSRRKLYECSRKLPGPFAFPLVGSALHFIGSPYDIFSNIMKMYNQYPGIFRVWFGPRLFYAVSDPKYYEILLPHCLAKERWYKYSEAAIGHGLFAAPLDKWKRHRKIIMPTFSQKILDGFVEIFSEQSEILVEQMRKFAGKGEFDIFDIMSKCTLDIICETAMGVKVNTQTSADTSLSTCIDRILENIFLRAFVIWYHYDAIFNLTARSKAYKASLKILHDFSGSVVRQRKRLFDESRKANKLYFEEDSRKKTFLDHLIEITSQGNQFTERELRDEVDTFIIAGSDTTASTNSYVFLMLGLHKDLQEKVYEEIIEVVGPSRPVEREDLVKLKYMDRFIKETLRLFPVAGVIVRAIEEDVDLGDHLIPGGTSVIFGILRTHTNEKYWPEPFKFDPDRFLPEEVAKRHPCTYLPFSYGPRNCLGIKYAMMAMKTLLATVLRKFKVSTSYGSIQDIKLKANLVLRPTDGYKVSLELRQYSLFLCHGRNFSTGVKKQNFKAGTWKTQEILLATLVCILLIWYLHFLWSRRKLYHCSRRLPGPSVLTLLECFLRCIINPHSLFPFAMKLCDEYSGIFRVWFGPRLFLVTSEPKHYEILLAHCLSKDKWYNFGEQAVGHGLFNAPLKTWKKHRKIIMPTFNQKIIDGFVEIFSEQSQILVEQMEKFAGKGEFDVFEELITKCTVDIICETAMGVKVSNQTTDDRPVSKWIDRVLENTFVRAFVFHYHFDAIFNLTARSKGDRAALKNFHDFSGSVIKEKKQLLDKARKQRKDSEDFVEERKRKVFLDYLLVITADGNQFTEQELRDEVNTFVITGSDTTASTIAFVLIMLGLHKDLQEKVYEEIIEVVGPKRTVEKDDLPKLCHMDRFIKETLRLFPVAGFIARATEEEVDLGDQVIPGGVSVVFMILSTHTNKRFWPDPFKFDPDRFLPEEVEKRHPCAYIPFSYGRRNCIGMKYAMMSMKTLLATVMRKFKFDTSYKSVKEIELKFNTVMRPKDGYKLSLEPR